MSVCDGDNDMVEVISARFSENCGFVVEQKEAGEDIEDDMEDMEEKEGKALESFAHFVRRRKN